MRDKIIGFDEFVIRWSQEQFNCKPPDLHVDLAKWVEQSMHENGKIAILAFRGAGKSTIVGLFCVWLLVNDPNLRIIILSAEQHLCSKMISFARVVIDSHPYLKEIGFEDIKSDIQKEWSRNSITIKRDIHHRDPSILARSINSNYTGCRADIAIFDDIEVPNTCNTNKKRGLLREKIQDIEYVLYGRKRKIYIGTPHHEDSIYYGSNAVIHDCLIKKIPLINSNGEMAIENFMSKKDLELIKHTNHFKSQMMMQPASHNGPLKFENIKKYNSMDMKVMCNNLYIQNRRIIFASGWLDVAYGKGNGNDKTALAILYRDFDNNFYVEFIDYIDIDISINSDESRSICVQVINLLKKHRIKQLRIETNGIGKFLPSTMRDISKDMMYNISIVSVHSYKNKEERIMEAMDWTLSMGKLYFNENIFRQTLINDIRYWSPKDKGKDDAIDAISSCIMHSIGE